MKFDLADFLELDTKALMAINGGGTCGGGSCSSGGGSCSGGSRGSSSYGGSCSSGSSYGGSCGSGSYGGSCSGSYGGSCSGSSYGGSCSGGTSYGGSCGGSYGGSCGGGSYGGSCGGSSYGGSCGGGSYGGSCSGSYGGSCSGSSYGGSCSGGTSYAGSCGVGSSYGGSCSGGGAVGGSCGGGSVVVKPLIPTPSVSAGSSEDNSTPSPTEPIPNYEGIFVENSDYGVANAKPGDKIKRENGTIVVITQGDIDWAKKQLGIDETTSSGNEEITAPTIESSTNEGVTTEGTTPSSENNVIEDAIILPSSGENDVPNNPNVDESTPSTTEPKNDLTNLPDSNPALTELTATDKIEKAIIDVGDKKYVDGYRCDEYVEDILKNAGYDPKDYFVDNPSGKYVNDHISELKASKEKKYTTDASKLTEGTYVVFMADEQGTKDSHASILVVDSNGNAYMQDNSSTNNVLERDSAGKAIKWAGGTETTYGGNAEYICSLYTGYENWYFQKLE